MTLFTKDHDRLVFRFGQEPWLGSRRTSGASYTNIIPGKYMRCIEQDIDRLYDLSAWTTFISQVLLVGTTVVNLKHVRVSGWMDIFSAGG